MNKKEIENGFKNKHNGVQYFIQSSLMVRYVSVRLCLSICLSLGFCM